jgi:hypothetical protein
LALELCLDGLQVHLPSPWVIHLLLKVDRIAVGTLVQWHGLRRLLRQNLVVDVVAHTWWGVAVDVIGVILWAIPGEDLEEGAQQGDVCPHGVEEDGASWRVIADEVL